MPMWKYGLSTELMETDSDNGLDEDSDDDDNEF
jgi:hypothetical protein